MNINISTHFFMYYYKLGSLLKDETASTIEQSIKNAQTHARGHKLEKQHI